MLQSAALAFCFSLLITVAARAQDGLTAQQSVSTTPPANARYEIVQSPLAARWTFRLDRYTGRVDQMVKAKDETLSWEAMPVMGLPKLPLDAKPRYQIFASGIAARYTFLINNETGHTWQLATDTSNKDAPYNYWSPFP